MRLFRFAFHVAVLAVLVFLSPLVQAAQVVAVPRLTDLAGELRYLPMAHTVGFQLRLPAPSQLVSTETNHP